MDVFEFNLFQRRYCFICKNIAADRIFPETLAPCEPSFDVTPVEHLRREHREYYKKIFNGKERYCVHCGLFEAETHTCDNKFGFHVDNFQKCFGITEMPQLSICLHDIVMEASHVYSIADRLVSKLEEHQGKEVIPKCILEAVMLIGSVATRSAIATSDVDVVVLIDMKETLDKECINFFKEFVQSQVADYTHQFAMLTKERRVLRGSIGETAVDISLVESPAEITLIQERLEETMEILQSFTSNQLRDYLRGKGYITALTADFPSIFSKKLLVNTFQRHFCAGKDLISSLVAGFSDLEGIPNGDILEAVANELEFTHL